MENHKDNLTQEELAKNWKETLKWIGKRSAIGTIALAACFGLSKYLEKQWDKDTPYPQGATVRPITEDTTSAISDTLQCQWDKSSK